MSYLVDTDWVVSYLKGRPEAIGLLSGLAREGLAISLITFGEVYEGIYYGADPAGNESGFLRFLRFADVLPLNQGIMKQFAQIRGDLRRKGQLIGDSDILIAATALAHDLTLMTRNTAHFRRIPGLKMYQF